MVGAGDVITQRFAAAIAHEDGAGVAQFGKQRFGLGDGEFKMLRRDAVGDGAGLGERAGADQRATRVEGSADDGRTRHRRQQPLDARRHGVDERAARRQQHRLRQFVVLGLREEIHRHPVRARAVVGDDENLRWTGDHVDADQAEHAALGRGDIGIAGADDLVDRRQRGRAVGERADRLRAADGEHAINAREVRRREHRGVGDAIGRRHHHDDLAHAGHLGRHRVHQHRRGVRGLAARHVEPDPIERRDRDAEHRAIGFDLAPADAQLSAVVALDALTREHQRVADVGIEPVKRRREFARRTLQRRHARRLHAIEARRVVEHRGVTARAHVGEDGRHGVIDVFIERAALPGQRIERREEIGSGGVEPFHEIGKRWRCEGAMKEVASAMSASLRTRRAGTKASADSRYDFFVKGASIKGLERG